MGLKSIAIPAISSGIFGFPKVPCAKIMVKTAKKFIDSYEDTSLTEIRFTNFSFETCEVFNQALKEFFLDTEKEITLDSRKI